MLRSTGCPRADEDSRSVHYSKKELGGSVPAEAKKIFDKLKEKPVLAKIVATSRFRVQPWAEDDLAERKSISANGGFSLCNSAKLTMPASKRLLSNSRRSCLRKKTFAAVGVLGSARNARWIKGTRWRAGLFRTRASHAALESVGATLAERFLDAFTIAEFIVSGVLEHANVWSDYRPAFAKASTVALRDMADQARAIFFRFPKEFSRAIRSSSRAKDGARGGGRTVVVRKAKSLTDVDLVEFHSQRTGK